MPSDLHLCCALGGIRTPNLLIRSQMLYPLSYERGVVISFRRRLAVHSMLPGRDADDPDHSLEMRE